MDITKIISGELEIKNWQTEAVIRLIDEGSTIPFIARYRKEATGALDDTVLRKFAERLTYLRALEDRKGTVISTIESQGKMTPALAAAIEKAQTNAELEDLYRPYRPKRRTRAMIAREKGLEPLAKFLMDDRANGDVQAEAGKYVDAEKGIADAAQALQMAQDIIAEEISDSPEERAWIRKTAEEKGEIVTVKRKRRAAKGAAEEAPVNQKLEAREAVYANYEDFCEPVCSIPGHRVLALNRGEKEEFLTVSIDVPEEDVLRHMERRLHCDRRASGVPYRKEAAKDAWKRLILPQVTTEVRGELTAKAEEGAIGVFGANLRQLLLQPPLSGKTVLGWDPAFRTGCKLAVSDPEGKILATTVIYPTAPQNKVKEAEEVLEKLIRRYHVDVISVGNGTASRESEKIIADFLRRTKLPVKYAIVSEAGASVYSASETAAKEFPNFDVGQRSSASIARRLQDPLAELVKIDPKAIGVGQYQHDMNEKRMDEALRGVVEDAVNSVGVNLNTASAVLLSFISGISATVAENIVKYREEHGAFSTRKELLKVPKLGPKAYEQCAGFLRIRGGKEPLDMTGVHPESYEAARTLLAHFGCSEEDLKSGVTRSIAQKIRKEDLKKLSEQTGLGEYTLKDVIDELSKPGRDPREDAPAPVLRQDVMDLESLKEGMILTGTIRNIVDFGAFVDIGVHQDGLVHISQLADRFVKNPLDVVSVGDVVKVRVLSVDVERKKISLSMKNAEEGKKGK
ncbi:MAG: RNA-binding transcriptional accessory protein [Clostridium sp.]|nr:RNA-binding transcriptional accessory protein [Clostridium sp.]